MSGSHAGCHDPDRLPRGRERRKNSSETPKPRAGKPTVTLGHVTRQMQFWGSDCFGLTSGPPRGPCTLSVGGSLSARLRTSGSSKCSPHLTQGCHTP